MTTTTPLRILVVGDRDDTRLTACWMLERAFDPVEVLQATSPEEANENCAGDRVDCILVDAQTSAFEDVVKAVLTAAGQGLVPVVVLLGKGDEAARATAQQLGVIDWLRKDQVSPAVVGLTVRRAIDVASLRLMLAEQGRELERLRESEADAAAAAKEAKLRASGPYHAPEPSPNAMPVQASVETEPPSENKPATDDESVPPSRESELPEPPARELLVAPKFVTSGFGTLSAEDDELAQRIQKDLMPAGAPYLDGFDVAGLTLSAATTGGDYYDYLPVGDDLLTITIGECSGRGLAPAMLVASLRAYL
jgi:CheY-like chemotaxis protein